MNEVEYLSKVLKMVEDSVAKPQKKKFSVTVQFDKNGREIWRGNIEADTKEEAEEWATEWITNNITAFAEED